MFLIFFSGAIIGYFISCMIDLLVDTYCNTCGKAISDDDSWHARTDLFCSFWYTAIYSSCVWYL